MKLSFLLDTNVAIHLRDGDPFMVARVAGLPDVPSLSIVTRVELIGGIRIKPAFAAKRREALIALLETFKVFDFGAAEALAYDNILAVCGYSRPRILDRMIAATALVHDCTVITQNGADFADVPGLKLDVWPQP